MFLWVLLKLIFLDYPYISWVLLVGEIDMYVLSIVRLTLSMQRNAEVKTKQSLKYFNAFR